MIQFFICGVQKGGTTALSRFLGQHPDIAMPECKELHFFDDESIDWAAPDYGRLDSPFQGLRPLSQRGDATPIYCYWPQAMERLRAYNPNAKLIVLLRHPVLRAWSHWRMEVTRGYDSMPFSEAIRAYGRERVRLACGGVHRVFSYVERGFYAPQIERILGLFPRRQLLVIRTDTLWSEFDASMKQIQAFLEVPCIQSLERQYVVPVPSGPATPLANEDAEYLNCLYAEDILRTQLLTGLDLRDWLQPPECYQEPIRSERRGRERPHGQSG